MDKKHTNSGPLMESADKHSIYKALEGEVSNLEDIGADVIAVQRMFDFLFNIVDELSPNLQIIVTEHANLGNERFQHALVEEPWRGERALIPLDWLE